MPELTLADVIEKGFADIGRQGIREIFDWSDRGGKPDACCVLGAAAWGLPEDTARNYFRDDEHGSVMGKTIRAVEIIGGTYDLQQSAVWNPNSELHRYEHHLWRVLMYLNDGERVRIPAIATWLRKEAAAGRININPRKED